MVADSDLDNVNANVHQASSTMAGCWEHSRVIVKGGGVVAGCCECGMLTNRFVV